MNSIVHRILSRVRGRDITVDITQADINKGVRGSPTWCPIALIVKRMFPTAVQISASRTGVQVVFITHSLRFEGPSTMYDWVGTFDRRGPDHVQPRSFRLSLTDRIEHDPERQAVLRRWFPVYP